MLERVVAPNRRIVLVHGQHLSQLLVERVVDVELQAPRQRGPGHLLLYVPTVRHDRFVRFDIRSVADIDRPPAYAGIALEALVLQILPRRVAQIRRPIQYLLEHVLRVVLGETPLEGEVIVAFVQTPLFTMTIRIGGDTARSGPFLNLLQEQTVERPVRLRITHGGHGLDARVAERHEGRRPGNVIFLVIARRGKDIVAVSGGVAHAPVQGDQQIQFGKHVLDQLGVAAHTAEEIAPDGEHDAGRCLRHELPFLFHRLLEVVIELSFQMGVPALGAAIQLLEPPVLVVKECRGQDVPTGIVLAGEMVDHHFVGIAGQLQS